MADVYCAQDLQLGRKVALKILYRRFAEDGEFVERFRREASSAAGLQHQHVVAVYDRGEYDGTYYIAMEYLEGRSLKTIVQQEAPLDPDRAIDLTIQVLRAARFAHRRGIIHRDLKPHNVIVDAEGRAKVTDFGIARAGASDMTQTGSIMGTAQYLSPEQAQGHAVSAASDIYSIGIMLYELLTGRVPVRGRERGDDRAQAGQRAPGAAERATTPRSRPSSRRSCMRALEKDPARRFPDADAFIAALQAARDGTGHGRPRAACRRRRSILPSEAYAYPEEPLAAARAARGRALVAVAAGGARGRPRPRRRAAAARHAEGRRAHGRRRRPGQRRGQAAPGRLPASTPTQKTAEQPKGQVIGQDPTGGTQGQEGLDGDAHRLRRPAAGGGAAGGRPDRLLGARAIGEGRPQASEREENSDTVDEGQGDLGQPDRGPEGRQGLVGHARRLQRQAAGRRSPTSSARASTRRSRPCRRPGFKVTRTDKESDTKDPGTVLSQNPKSGTQDRRGLDGRAHGGQGAQPGRRARRDRRGRARGDRGAVRRRAS